MENTEITLCAVGDIVGFHKDYETAFDYVKEVLCSADITFAQNERHYNDRGDTLTSTAGISTEVSSVKSAESLKLGGFDVLSFASNHSMDFGANIMLESVEILRKCGFKVIGVGENLDEARKPALIERKGTKVAFLAYASVLRSGYEAGKEKAGSAPMRAWTHYNQIDYQPGTPPQILTFPYKNDLENVLEDVKMAKKEVDIVAVSFHWGLHFMHASLAMYEKEVAHAVIDEGADMILGHHPHLPKGIEVYKGKPIFYSMGNFAFDKPYDSVVDRLKKVESLNQYAWKPDPEWENYAFPSECRKSMIVKITIDKDQIKRVVILPVLINKKAQPCIIKGNDERFNEMFEYYKEITESQDLPASLTIDGDEIVIS